MKSNEIIHIAIAETTPILRGGLALVLKNLPNLRIQPIEILSTGSLNDCMQTKAPDILIINPFFDETFDVQKFREMHNNKHIRIIALTHSFINENVLSKYDETISVFHDSQTLNKKIVCLLQPGNEEESQENLSIREKEIVVCVVKGMTNKEIADSLFLSVHTVITHRRNISRKLQIHSPSGLTIYAIMNKLVNLNEIKLE